MKNGQLYKIGVEELEDGLWHTTITNRRGRKWVSKKVDQYPDNLHEGAMELDFYLNEYGGTLNKDLWLVADKLGLWLEKISDWTQDAIA